MSGSKAPDTIIIEERQNRRKDIMKIGFIGLGNMATAMIGGMLQKGIAAPEDIIGSARTETTVEKVKTKFNINTTTDNKIVAAQTPVQPSSTSAGVLGMQRISFNSGLPKASFR